MTKLSDDQVNDILNSSGVDTSDTSISFEEIDDFGSNDSIKEMYQDVGKYRRMLREKRHFINADVSAVIPFTRENLYLICAYTGSGKSTMAANISYPLWQQGKKILVISNEESKQDVIFRIACLHLGYNFNDYKKGCMPKTLELEVLKLFPQITKCVKVVDVNFKEGLTTKKEGVINILEQVKNSDYAAVLLDYYQLVRYSTNNAEKTYKVLDDLRIYFGRYIKDANVPLVVFAQLHSLGKRNNTDLDSRIKECPAIIEPATVILEMVPNFELNCTDVNIKKDRFGSQGTVFRLGYDKGKFVTYDSEFEAKINAFKQKKDTEEAAKRLAALQQDLGNDIVDPVQIPTQDNSDVQEDTGKEDANDTTAE